jgi:hypothetical protein
MEHRNQSSLTKSWILTGIGTGLVSLAIYPLMLLVDLPDKLLAAMAGLFGPLLAISSIGTYYFISLHRKTVIVQIAALSNIAAGVTVNLMMIVQLSVNQWMSRSSEIAPGGPSGQILGDSWKVVNQVQLGLDISWDIFISMGTLLFAVAMLRHPKLGKLLGVSGILLGASIFVVNFLTFPMPPAETGLFDLGPIMGLWYLIVGIKLIFSLKWVDERLAQKYNNSLSIE